MHELIYAQAEIALTLTTRAPLLVRNIDNTKHPDRHSDRRSTELFAHAYHPEQGKSRYRIPATSLKGVWRSGIEQLLRTFDPKLACNPFAALGKAMGCGYQLAATSPAQAYAKQCPACRLFGSTAHRGLVRIQDGWAALGTSPLPAITGIAVDRVAGNAKGGALYTTKPLPKETTFSTTLSLTNPEWWHLGLLALVWRDMSDGRLALGAHTRRGMGLLSVQVERFSFTYPAPTYAAAQQDRTARLCPASALAANYPHPLRQTDQQWILPDLQPTPSNGWRDEQWTTFALTPAQVQTLFTHAVDVALAPRLQAGRAAFDQATTATTGATTDGS